MGVLDQLRTNATLRHVGANGTSTMDFVDTDANNNIKLDVKPWSFQIFGTKSALVNSSGLYNQELDQTNPLSGDSWNLTNVSRSFQKPEYVSYFQETMSNKTVPRMVGQSTLSSQNRALIAQYGYLFTAADGWDLQDSPMGVIGTCTNGKGWSGIITEDMCLQRKEAYEKMQAQGSGQTEAA